MNSGIQDRCERAQSELAQQISDVPSPNSARSLWTGLRTLRTQLLTRLHSDVEAEFGVDSALAPATADEAIREMRCAAEEIDAYSLVLVINEVSHSGYAKGDVDWFRKWLLRLCLGNEVDPSIVDRLRCYDRQSDGQRRRMFSSFLEQALPEARKAPLIIYRLFPRAVRIVTALAFGDALRAQEIRAEQISYLPAIEDCHHCNGLPIENGEICEECGNPLWKIRWLTATE